jgi:hypothetical protein
VGGWDFHIDHDFYVRAYDERLKSKRFLVSRYATANKNTRRFKIQGTNRDVMVHRGTTTFSHTLSVPEHSLSFQEEVSTPSIVCMALTSEGFILIPEDIESEPLF